MGQMVETLENYSIITWSGKQEEPNMYLQTYKDKIPCNPLEGHSSMILNQKQTRAFVCENQEDFTVTVFKNENWCYAAIQKGFKVWNINDERFVELKLPSGVR